MHLAAQPHTDAPIAIAWEECACLLCGGAYLTPIFEASDPSTGLRFLVVRCNRCGFCFTNPRPDVGASAQFYPADYRCHQSKERPGKVDPVARLLPIEGQGRLLDFGCGAGDFLQRMHERGWTVTGLDSAAAAVARVAARGLSAHVGTLPHALWPNACFEAITMRQSLEHTHQPLDVVRAAFRLLTTGGRLVVTVPNFDSLAARWFGVDWYGLDLPRHLSHFTPGTLRHVLSQAGFVDIEMHQEIRGGWIRHSAELARRRGDRSGWTRVLQSRWGSTFAGWWGRLRGRADCLVAVAVK